MGGWPGQGWVQPGAPGPWQGSRKGPPRGHTQGPRLSVNDELGLRFGPPGPPAMLVPGFFPRCPRGPRPQHPVPIQVDLSPGDQRDLPGGRRMPGGFVWLVSPPADGAAPVQHPLVPLPGPGPPPAAFPARDVSRAARGPGCALPVWRPYPGVLCNRSLESSLQPKGGCPCLTDTREDWGGRWRRPRLPSGKGRRRAQSCPCGQAAVQAESAAAWPRETGSWVGGQSTGRWTRSSHHPAPGPC